jgi:hypothetical protein
VLAGLAPGVDAAAVARCVGLVLRAVAGADVRGWKLREIVDEVRQGGGHTHRTEYTP